MPNIHCAVVIPYRSGLPEDVAVNTWTFGAGATTPFDMAVEARERLEAFYNTVPSGASDKVTDYLAAYLDKDSARFKAYDLSDPQPRVPVLDVAIDIGDNQTTQDLPHEVALCLSFQGDRESGVNQARRRGRIYLGPLTLGAKTNGSNEVPRPKAAFLTAVQRAAGELVNKNDGTANWVVWSRKGGTFAKVTGGWVDNEFDTQRRRGARATDRSWFNET